MLAFSGCATLDPAGIIGRHVGAKAGVAIADQIPVVANTKPKAGGNACDALKALGWPTTLRGISGPDAALNTIGATQDTAKECP